MGKINTDQLSPLSKALSDYGTIGSEYSLTKPFFVKGNWRLYRHSRGLHIYTNSSDELDYKTSEKPGISSGDNTGNGVSVIKPNKNGVESKGLNENAQWSIDREIEGGSCCINGKLITGDKEGNVLSISTKASGDGYKPEIEWETNLTSNINTDVCTFDIDSDGKEEIFLGSETNTFHCLDQNGNELFSQGCKSNILPYIKCATFSSNSEKHVIFGSDDRSIYCLDSKGEKVFRFELENNLLSEICVNDLGRSESKIIFGTKYGKIFLLNEGGGIVWRKEVSGPLSNMKIKGGHIYFVAEDQKVYCLDFDGQKIDEFQIHPDSLIVRGYITDITNNGNLDLISLHKDNKFRHKRIT